ncbi:MAG: serine hydrolase, partial [Bacteroidales bacterium]|nr:serine hydrolase [Bacteroidales bacterium]
MKTIYLVCILILLSYSHLSAQDFENEVNDFIQNQINTHHIPAISVAVIDRGVVRFQKTYGNAVLEFAIPNTDSTAFQLASVTKLISATALVLLVQE